MSHALHRIDTDVCIWESFDVILILNYEIQTHFVDSWKKLIDHSR